MSRSGSDFAMASAGASGRAQAKGLIDAVSEIEYYFAQERRGSVLSEGFFTTKDRLEFFAVGFKTSFLSGLITALFTPLAIGVLEKMIPVFGSTEPSAWDTFFVFMLSLGYSVGYASFITPTAYCYIGSYTKTMIRSLIGGVVTGAAAKAVIAFVAFHFFDMVVMTPANSVFLSSFIAEWWSYRHAVAVHAWLMEFKPVLLMSAYFVLFTTGIFISIPLGAIAAASLRNRRLKAAGLIPAENQT